MGIGKGCLGRGATPGPAAGDGRGRGAAGRSRSAPAQPRCPGRAAPEAAPRQGARKPWLLLWPSSSFADLPYSPFPPGCFLPPPPPLVRTAPPPAASRSPCPGAPPRWCGMRWVRRSAAPLPGHLASGARHSGSPLNQAAVAMPSHSGVATLVSVSVQQRGPPAPLLPLPPLSPLRRACLTALWPPKVPVRPRALVAVGLVPTAN